MKRHQLYLIQLFFALAALHHIAQRKACNHLGERHRLIEFVAFQHLSHPAKELINVFHTHFRRFGARRGFVQPGFIVNTVDEIAHGGDRLAFGQTLDFPSQWVKRVNES